MFSQNAAIGVEGPAVGASQAPLLTPLITTYFLGMKAIGVLWPAKGAEWLVKDIGALLEAYKAGKSPYELGQQFGYIGTDCVQIANLSKPSKKSPPNSFAKAAKKNTEKDARRFISAKELDLKSAQRKSRLQKQNI